MTTSLPAPGSADVLYIVDLSSYVFRAYHAIAPLSSPEGEPTHATYGTVAMLQKLLSGRRPSHVAVAMDSKTPTFRHQLDPSYKANRKAPPPDLSLQMERARQIVVAYRIAVLACEGVEADDVIATAVGHALRAGLFVVIVGGDKDLMQLVGDRVVLWDTMRDKVYGPPEVQEKFGVAPDKLRDLLALMGDSSDNVPGVPKVGPKTAAELIVRFGTLDGVFAHVGEIEKVRLRDLLVQHESDARLSQRLVTLKADVPIGYNEADLRYAGADVQKLLALFQELGFTRMAAQLAAARPPVDVRAAPSACSRALLDVPALREEIGRIRRTGKAAISVQTTSDTIVGIGLASAPGAACYVPVAHRYLGAPKQLTVEQALAELGPVLADPEIRKIGHDLKHAMVVLAKRGAELGGAWLDVMLASYLLDPEGEHSLPAVVHRELDETLDAPDEAGLDEVAVDKMADYVGGNADAMLRLADQMQAEVEREGLWKLLRDVEMPLACVLAEMERVGVLVDTGELAKLKKSFETQLADLEERAHAAAGHPFNLSSPRQLESILFDELGLTPGKRTKTGRLTDAAVLEALADQHQLPRILLEHRQLSKLVGTYLDALPKLVRRDTGRIHTEWGQAVAATGRISSNNPNLQNIPVRTEVGRAIRRAFVAPKGMAIVSADYSQIELRVLAHLSKDPVLIDAFRTGQDVHERTAMELFEVAADGVTDDMRRKAKTINFGVLYGMGEVALAKRLGIGRAEAAAFIEAYFGRYGRVRAFMEEMLEEARERESVRTLFGRRRLLPNLRSSNGMLRSAAERIAQNTPIQGTAADLLKMAMLRLATPVVAGARMVLTVHDELVFEVPEAQVAVAMERVKDAMQGVYPELEVPLVVDVGSGPSWGQVHYGSM